MTESVKGESRPLGGMNSRLPRGGRLLGPLLGLVFLIYPVRAVLTSEPTPARVALALGGAAPFAGVFLWLMWTQEPLWSLSAEPSEIRKHRATVAFLAVLAISLNLVLGSEWRVLFFHVNVAAGIMLLTRDAYVAIAGLAVVTFGLGLVSGMAWLALPTAAIGLWATAFVRQVAAVAELRSAREELARMAVNEEVARQALGEVREAVAGYRSPTLDEELAGAREMLGAAGISCRIENEAGLLPKEIDGVLAWAVREGTTNVIRHSQAQNCRIILAREDSKVYAEITDNGRGKTNEETSGSGLSGLAERVAGFGDGEFEAGPLREGGFRLRVELPLGRAATP